MKLVEFYNFKRDILTSSKTEYMQYLTSGFPELFP